MRRPHDFYETGFWQTRALLHHQSLHGLILEPCVGDGSIARVIREVLTPLADMLRQKDYFRIVTNDIDGAREANYHFDAADPQLYAAIERDYGQQPDFVVTNPPYTMPTCTSIVEQAVLHARKAVAMLLRISFREPTAKKNPRGPFLEAHPISRVLTLPRYSYTQNGKTDSTTTEWDIWHNDPQLRLVQAPAVLSLYKADEIFAA